MLYDGETESKALREGPIRCIFFCEFHPTAGPIISCQVRMLNELIAERSFSDCLLGSGELYFKRAIRQRQCLYNN